MFRLGGLLLRIGDLPDFAPRPRNRSRFGEGSEAVAARTWCRAFRRQSQSPTLLNGSGVRHALARHLGLDLAIEAVVGTEGDIHGGNLFWEETLSSACGAGDSEFRVVGKSGRAAAGRVGARCLGG